MDNWHIFNNVNFSDENMNSFHIDTRDFHCSASEKKGGPDLTAIQKNPKSFFCTPEEVTAILTRLFNESGGAVGWRCLYLDGSDNKHTGGWLLKYLRVYRTDLGLLICNSKNRALNKSILKLYRVNQELLSAH